VNLLATRTGRLAAFFLLYLTQGLPIGFCAGAVAVYLRREGIAVDEMAAFVAAVYAPWGFKWAAGPFVDLLGSRRLGRRRGWILLAQALMVGGFLLSSRIDPTENLSLYQWSLVAVSAAAALQDVAIDALAVTTLREEERGLGNGLMFAGAYLGQAIGGSGMLYMAGALGGLSPTYAVLAAIVGAVWMTVLLALREPVDSRPTTSLAAFGQELWAYVGSILQALLMGGRALATLALALLPTGAMALSLALSSALAVELGLSDDEIATLSLIGAVAGATGSVTGGWISDRLGHRRMLAVYVVLTVVPSLVLAALMHRAGWILPVTPDATMAVPDRLVPAFALASISCGLVAGLAYGTRMAIFMGACTEAVAATQFTAYMAAMNLSTSVAAWWQGAAVVRWGYPTTLTIDAAIGLLCIGVLPFIKTSRMPTSTTAPT
jgi:PAT family beta-lactamase induction signal transducer AmpG